MIRVYNEHYLTDVMETMGAMLDYAVNSCGEDRTLFYARFLRSGIPEQIERGNPRYLCGISGIEMAMEVARRTGPALKEAEPYIDMGSPEYWTGWALGYLQRTLDRGFMALYRAGLDDTALHSRYAALHEADLTKVLVCALQITDNTDGSRLKRQRKAAHMTQRQLSELSGVSLRVLRAYEQSRISLSAASAGHIIRLSRALSCTPEQLAG